MPIILASPGEVYVGALGWSVSGMPRKLAPLSWLSGEVALEMPTSFLPKSRETSGKIERQHLEKVPWGMVALSDFRRFWRRPRFWRSLPAQ